MKTSPKSAENSNLLPTYACRQHVCMNVCMNVCMMCVCMCRLYVYMYICVCACACMSIYVCTCSRMYMSMNVYLYVCMNASMYACMHARTYVLCITTTSWPLRFSPAFYIVLARLSTVEQCGKWVLFAKTIGITLHI